VLRIHDIMEWIRIRLLDPDPDSDPDPDLAIFVTDPQDGNKKLKKRFFANDVLKVHFHHFQRKKVKNKSKSSKNQGFCLLGDTSA
jgi:hypothetical protein